MRINIETAGGGGVVLLVVVALLAGGHGAGIGAALAAVLIALAVVVALALGGLVAFLVYRARREVRPHFTYRPAPIATAEVRQLPAHERPAIEAAAPHLHFHGVDANDVAEILRRHQADQ